MVALIADALGRWAVERPDQPCITRVGDDGEIEPITFAALARRVRRVERWVSSCLQDMAGSAGAPVGLIAGNDIETVASVLGLQAAGRCCLVLNPADPPARIEELVRAAGACMVLRSPSATGHTSAIVAPATDGGEALDPRVRSARETRAFIFPTSGSTAGSKLVVQSHRAVNSNAEGVSLHHGLAPGVTVLGGLPLHHVNGMHFTIMGVIRAGAHVVLPQSISAFSYLDMVDRWRPQLASVVPSVLEVLGALKGDWRPPAEFGYFVTAAAPLQNRTARQVWEQWRCRVIQGYGLTEATNFSTTMPVDLDPESYRRLVLDRPLISIGTPFRDQELEIIDESGRLLPDGEVGEVCLRGPNLMDGYLGNPVETKRAFAGGWFHSGDLGYVEWDQGRRLLYLIGRLKHVAKVRGESVSLEEVERVALQVPGVLDAGAVTFPDRWEGEFVVLAVVSDQVVLRPLEQQLHDRLAPIHRPKDLVRVDRIPRTTTGKILRRLLVEEVDARRCAR